MNHYPLSTQRTHSPMSLFNSMDKMMGDWFGRAPAWIDWAQEEFLPPMELKESDGSFKLDLELPGMNVEDISLNLTPDNVLTVHGEKSRREEQEDGTVYRSERYFGTVERSLRLPAEVDASAVEASYRNGVLHVTLPKASESKTLEIKVKGEE